MWDEANIDCWLVVAVVLNQMAPENLWILFDISLFLEAYVSSKMNFLQLNLP